MDDFEKKLPEDTPEDDTAVQDAAEELEAAVEDASEEDEEVFEEDDAEEDDFYEKVSGKKTKPAAKAADAEPKKGSLLKPLLIIGGALVLIAAGLLFYFTVFPIAQNPDDADRNPDGTVVTEQGETFMTVNGTKISSEEMALMSMLVQDNDLTTAISIFEEYVVLLDMAKENNITLTADDNTQIDDKVAELKTMIESQGFNMPAVSDERFRELISVGLLANKLFEEYTKDYVIDEEHFESELYVYENDYPHYYIDLELKYIFASTYEDAEDARAMLAAGVDIDEVIETCSLAYEQEGVMTIKLVELLENGYVDDEFARSLIALGVGEWSEAIALSEESYVVMYVVNKASPSSEELREAFRELYSTQMRNEDFDVIYTEWMESIDSVTNQAVVDAFDLSAYLLEPAA